MAPAAQRTRWREARTRHVWHWCHFLAEADQLDRRGKLELARFCWSAFADAFWMRFDRTKFLRREERLRRSPAFCLGAIALAVVVVALAGGIVPVVRSFLSSPVRDPGRVWVISLNGKFRRVRSETLLDLASAWKGSRLLEAVAPYSWGPARLETARRTVPVLAARVDPEFFRVLDMNAVLGRTFFPADERTCGNCVVLSDEIWRLQFNGDSSVSGRQVMLDGSPRTIIGVLPRNFHVLSAGISVWMLFDSGTPPFSNFVERIGAVARTRSGATQPELEADLADQTENAGYVLPASLLTVTSGAMEMRRYLTSYFLFVLLAIASAMIIVYARSGGVGRAPLRVRDGLRWWSFFVAKSALLLAGTGLLAWSAVRWLSAYLFGSIHPMTNAMALWLFLALAVAPLSWSIRDQQRRCRVCLRRLGTPIPIGAPGHVLLDWSGTEMVCSAGHGVLYLADSQANWLERDRWDNLDDSWADLFQQE
ncbi:MAG TPA: ABC transporter permease [Candidatus Binatia bacterium]|nr:ABC transporter permease [Candidatus Binatia bacterium]